MKFVHSHSTYFDGDPAECVKWLGYARGVLSWMINRMPMVKSKQIMPEDGVTVTVTQNPNAIRITVGLGSLAIACADLTSPAGGGLFHTHTRLYRNNDSLIKATVPYDDPNAQFNKAGHLYAYRNWINNKGTEAISWNATNIYYRGKAVDRVGFLFNDVPDSVHYNFRAVAVKSSTVSSFTALIFAFEYNDVSGSFSSGIDLCLFRVNYRLVADKWEYVSSIKATIDVDAMLPPGWIGGKSSYLDYGGIARCNSNSVFSGDSSYLCTISEFTSMYFDISVGVDPFYDEVQRIDIDALFVDGAVLTANMVYQYLPEHDPWYATFATRGHSLPITSIDSYYKGVLINAPVGLGYNLSCPPRLVNDKLYMVMHGFTGVVGAVGDVGFDITSLKIYYVSIDMITNDVVSEYSGIEYNLANGGLGRLYAGDAYYKILFVSEYDMSTAPAVTPTECRYHVYINGVKEQIALPVADRFELSLPGAGACPNTIPFIFPFLESYDMQARAGVIDDQLAEIPKRAIFGLIDTEPENDMVFGWIPIKKQEGTVMLSLNKQTKAVAVIDKETVHIGWDDATTTTRHFPISVGRYK